MQSKSPTNFSYAGQDLEGKNVIDNYYTFEVEDLVYARTAVRHAQVMKKYSDQQLDLTTELREQLLEDDFAFYKKVESILQWRKQRAKPVELLVRWVSFGPAS